MDDEPKYPSIICVSELLRTWETAILLFLTNKNSNLTLFISPFLREKGLFPSDSPGVLEDQLYEFMRFLVFLGQLKKFTKDAPDIKDLFSWIPNSFTITFKHYSGSFTDDFIRRIRRTQLFTLKVTDDGSLEINCPSISSITLDKFITQDMLITLQELYTGILDVNALKDVNEEGEYTKYSNNTSTTLTYPDPEPIPAFNDNNLNKVSSPPSITTFAKWCSNNIQKLINPNSNIVYFVSHSHIMQEFVKKVIKLNDDPDGSFTGVYDKANKTNSWSLFFNVKGVNFKGFRHAFSCDNRYDKKGLRKILHRIFLGSYTNLALWGILSTAIF